MNRYHILLVVGLMAAATSNAWAAKSTEKTQTTSLEDQMKALDAGNQAPASVTREKLYAVQSRYLPLTFKSEFTLGGASNLTGDSFLRTQQVEIGYRFHFNDRWSAGVDYAWVDNAFKSDADNLKSTSGAIPDVPYAKTRADLMVEYNVFYGKFRFSTDTVSYFDQYVAIGPGTVEQNTGSTSAWVADVGFAFWLGQWGSARFGLKDYYYTEQYRSGDVSSNNIHAHLDLGYLF